MTFARKLTEHLERRAAQKEANLQALVAPSRSLHRGSYAGTTAAAEPKPEPYRDAALLEMAIFRPCLIAHPAACSRDVETVVACHSNLLAHGKGKARKADDHYSVWGCVSCHFWLDQGKASGEDKAAAFMEAHARQVLAWRLIALDPNEPERFRRAARRALARLNATPIGATA